jgi:hypothetical protein
VSQKDYAPGAEQEFWWMVEVTNHKVDLSQHPLLVKALEILLWVAALPHHRHWTAKQLALGALWNMAVRRPAVEEWLIRHGLVQVLVATIQDTAGAEGALALWPSSLRDAAAMLLGDLMAEHEMVLAQQQPAHVQVAALLSLVASSSPRLQVCGLRVLARLCYQAPLGHPKPERYLAELRTLLSQRGCCSCLVRMLSQHLVRVERMAVVGGRGRGGLEAETSQASVHAMSFDDCASDEVGPLALMAHVMRLLRNLSLDSSLQCELAALGLPTLFRTNHFLAAQLEAAAAGSTSVGPLHLDVVQNCSALLYNLASNPENRTRFYRLELAQSAVSEADRTVEKKRLAKKHGTHAHMGPRPPALPPPADYTLELGSPMRTPISPAGRPGMEVLPSGASTPRSGTMASHSDAVSMLSFTLNKTSSGFHPDKSSSLQGARLPPGTRTVTSPSGAPRAQSPSFARARARTTTPGARASHPTPTPGTRTLMSQHQLCTTLMSQHQLCTTLMSQHQLHRTVSDNTA